MADYPDSVYTPRAKANRSGVVYDPDKPTVPFAEDVTKLDDEVVAIEETLGTNPEGGYVDVAERLDDDEALLGDHHENHEADGSDEVRDIVPDATPDADHIAYGIKVVLVAAVELNFGDVGYINASGKVALVDADAIATSSGLFMCVDETIEADASGMFLAIGVARNDSWAFTPGGLIFITITGTTGNTLSQSAPTGEDDVVQIVGVATHADRMFFNPQLVQIELQAP